MVYKELISVEELRRVFSYNPENGQLVRVRSPLRHRIGQVAGTKHPTRGYRYVNVGRKRSLAHRIIWAIVTGSWPTLEIDHINGQTDDNRWANLRQATSAQNKYNSRGKKTKDGYKGVYRLKGKRPKWRAQIGVSGGFRILGSFDTPEAAHAAYVVGAQAICGEFANGGS